jgi:pSer/pThr/pTyr-binding forkhead associated (FHA) protein
MGVPVMQDARTAAEFNARETTALPDVLPAGPPAGFRPLRLTQIPGGFVLDLTRPNLVCGRHSEADLRLPLADVSRRHCRFEFTAGGWQVTDLGSLNGVYVNGQRVTHAPLAEGDVLRVGGVNLRAELPGENVLRSIAESMPERRLAS